MSDLSLKLVLSAVVDQFKRALGEASESEKALVKEAESANISLVGLGKEADSAGDHLAESAVQAHGMRMELGPLQEVIGALGLAELAGGILATNREYESLRVQLNAATGSAEKGSEAFEHLLTQASETPFEVKDVTAAYVKLKNFGLEPTEQVMRAVTEQSSKLGGSAETLSGLTLALGQAWSKGKLQAEEINQMIERGIPVYALLEAATGRNAAQLANMAQKGELTRDVIDKLIAKMGELASGSNARAMDTLNGKISNLADSWHKFEDALLNDKSEGLIKRIVGNWSAWIDFLTDKLDSAGGKWAELEALNARIAGDKSALAGRDPRNLIDQMAVQATTGRSIGEIQYDLKNAQAERETLLAAMVAENREKREAADHDAKALADSRAIADKAAAIADWSEKYASNAEKLDAELKKAKEELGDDFTPELEARIRAKFADKDALKERSAGEKALLAEQLQGIETRKAALKSAADLEKSQLQANFDAAKLGLDQQVADGLLSEEAKNRRLVELEKDLAAAKLDIARKLIEQEAELETQAVRAKISAARAEKPTSGGASSGSLASLINGGESGEAGYNAYNRGRSGDSAGRPQDLQSLTVGEILQRQALPKDNPDSLFAVGKYQAIPKTLKAGVAALGIDHSARFDADTQDAIFTDFLVKAKRPELQAYITGVSGDIAAAREALRNEFISMQARPVEKIDAVLSGARASYASAKAGGAGEKAAYRQAVLGGSSGGDGEEKAAKLRTLDAQLVAIERDKTAKLKALGVQEQADATHVAQAELAVRKDETAKSKALALEDAQARRDADLDALAGRESAAQAAHDLGALSDEQYLAQLRESAAERLRIEEDLLAAKRALLGQNALALAKNLHDKEQLERDYAAKIKDIGAQEARQKKAEFKSWMAPFESAIDSLVNGVISGQQSIGKAVRNAGQSMLISYTATFIKQRTMQAAEWAWELSGLAGAETRKRAIRQISDVWDNLFTVRRRVRHATENTTEIAGFGAKEGAKVATKAASETAQTTAQIVGDQARVASTVVAESESKGVRAASGASSVMGSAAQAAAGVYASVAAIPYVGWILGPIAAAAAFISVAGYKAFFSEKGEWEVGKDNAPYILHKKETVLPAGVAENFRRVVQIVREYVSPSKAPDAEAKAQGNAAEVTASAPASVAASTTPAPEVLASPASDVAGQFRRAVQIIKGYVAPPKAPDIAAPLSLRDAGPLAEIKAGFASGRFAPALSLPEFATTLPQASEASAARTVQAGRAAQARAQGQPEGGQGAGQPPGKAGKNVETHFHFHGDVIGNREFFDRNAQYLQGTLQRGARQFKGGKK